MNYKTGIIGLLLGISWSGMLIGQETQSIAGIVKDVTTQQPLIGATVSINIEGRTLGTTSDEDGVFVLSNVPLGRRVISSEYLGYEPFTSEGIMITSTRQVYLEIEMQAGGIDLNEIVVEAGTKVNRPVNDASLVSTRSFSADETDRIAASVNDPGRLALAYPGVAQGQDDNENDIIIRGNAPFGMTWRLEGIDIPNPNHFARPGTSGGGVTVFSSQLLSRSDFSTGGMPAEYGNTLSGVMDVHFRKGNKLDHQHRFKVGLLGIDVASEGPLKKGKSSYLVNYRYSTLGILTQLGVYLVGERVTNQFQDLSFNLAFDGDDKNKFTVFGLGGQSREHYNPVDLLADRDPLVADNWEDRIRDGNVGALGTTYTRFINDASLLKIGVALMGREIDFFYDVLNEDDDRTNYHDERHEEVRISSSAVYSSKLSSRTRIKAGMYYHFIPKYDFYKQTIARENISNVLVENADLSVSGKGSTSTIQLFGQISHNPTAKIGLNAGLHLMHFPLNNTSSVEPRLSIKFNPDARNQLSFAYGLYSKILPLATYFVAIPADTFDLAVAIEQPNFELPFIKSHHFIASYSYALPSGLKLSGELYYQSLFNVPISPDPDQYYWMLNTRTFAEREVVAEGTGKNYGIDIAIEKFFATKVYFLITGSLFNSTFALDDNRTFPTTFANKFVSSATLGREFQWKKNRVLQIGARVLLNGGNRYTPLDFGASQLEGRYIGDVNLLNDASIPNYFRIDTRIAYRYNNPKLSGSISLDIQNITNRSNPRGVGYAVDTNELLLRNHSSGLVPVLAFSFDF